MNNAVVDQALLWFFAALLLGPLVGAAVGWRSSFERGVGVGCLLIGLLTSGLGLWVAMDRWSQLRDTVAVTGQLLEYVEEPVTNSDRSVSTTLAPRVRYLGPDGQAYVATGLGGSQADREAGAAVPVRYRRDHPEQAVIADFQNVWGAVLALAIFGGLPTLFGTYFLMSSFPALALPSNRSSLSAGERAARGFWRDKLFIVGHGLAVATFAGMALSPYGVLTTVGAGFGGIGLACLVYLIAEFIGPTVVWQRTAIEFIVMAGFLLFSFVALVLA